ncbi:MAG TPA: hypothetical protein VNU19_09725, partial [Candidatus Acidoferrum sp.]|nr:hypothetical protein [Candidatus Acidoferrum sp.]
MAPAPGNGDPHSSRGEDDQQYQSPCDPPPASPLASLAKEGLNLTGNIGRGVECTHKSSSA